MTPAVFNPFDPAFRANPYPYYDALRFNEPVHTTAFGMVVLTRYDDVSTTLKSADFSRDIEKYSTQASSEARQARRDRQESRTKSILTLDPPEHTRLHLPRWSVCDPAFNNLLTRFSITHKMPGNLN
jgi:cytochrome P450